MYRFQMEKSMSVLFYVPHVFRRNLLSWPQRYHANWYGPSPWPFGCLRLQEAALLRLQNDQFLARLLARHHRTPLLRQNYLFGKMWEFWRRGLDGILGKRPCLRCLTRQSNSIWLHMAKILKHKMSITKNIHVINFLELTWRSVTENSRTLNVGLKMAHCRAQPRETASSAFNVVCGAFPKTFSMEALMAGTREDPPTISTE